MRCVADHEEFRRSRGRMPLGVTIRAEAVSRIEGHGSRVAVQDPELSTPFVTDEWLHHQVSQSGTARLVEDIESIELSGNGLIWLSGWAN